MTVRRTLHLRILRPDHKVGELLYPERDYWRPRTRGDCAQIQRPCPFVACRYHLGLEVTEAGSLVFLQSDPASAAESCALDVADRGGETLETIGQLYGLSRERVRQIEKRALARIEREVEGAVDLG